MDIQQLKLLAGRVRDLLEHANVSINHSQALDLSGALVGLRNWPEVQAFPARVAAAELDLEATSRLAHRLHKKHGLELRAEELLATLRALTARSADVDLPHVWPSGPRPGVYITTEPGHINALLRAYDDATDGALLYAERAGSHWETSIDLGEDGLWSGGMQRVPSGTLLVLGPLEMHQEAWNDTASRMESACLKVQLYGHRVAVLLKTETPDTLHHDVDLMVRMRDDEGGDSHEALLGVVSAAGELDVRSPFVDLLPRIPAQSSQASLNPIPAKAIPLLRTALERRPTGLLLLGSSEISEHWAIDLVNAVLPLTDFAGPAARIRPRRRGTPAKDWNVPDAVKALPFLPSIESAYSLGYRRMIINPAYSNEELLQQYSDEVLFIAGGHGATVDDLFLSGVRYGGMDKTGEALDTLVAILAVTPLKTSRVNLSLADMFVPAGQQPSGDDKFSAVLDILRQGRSLRADDELAQLLEDRTVTLAAAKKALTRTGWATEFLSERQAKTKAAG